MTTESEQRARSADPASLLLSKEISFDKMLVFSGYPETNSVHTSREFAVGKGLSNAVAQGLQTYAYMCEWLVGFFGSDWFHGGRLAVSFLGLVVPGDRISVKAELEEKEEVAEGSRVTLAIWCENHRGEKVAAGTATAVMR
jgi:acyl dehydratase